MGDVKKAGELMTNLIKESSPGTRDKIYEWCEMQLADLMHHNPEFRKKDPQAWESVKHLVGCNPYPTLGMSA